MLKPPSPPAGATEYLSGLADYYRQLVEYHQQAALVAAQQLNHVQALLGEPPVLSTTVEAQSWLLDESGQATRQIAETRDDDELDKESEPDQQSDLPLDDETEPFPVTLVQIRELLESDRGTMLHIDYIIRHFYGPISESQQDSVKPLIEKQLRAGAKLRMWSEVPDAPECWTLTLLDFPDLASLETLQTLLEKTEIPATGLPTKKVADLLSMTPPQIYELKKLYSEQIIRGVDYFPTTKKGYFWTEEGINKLAEFSQQLDSKKPKKTSTKVPSSPSMLPQYRGLNQLQAIEKFFKNHPGTAVSILEITEALYGQLTPPQTQKMREAVGKTLWYGKNKGLWRNLPHQSGFYQAIKPNR